MPCNLTVKLNLISVIIANFLTKIASYPGLHMLFDVIIRKSFRSDDVIEHGLRFCISAHSPMQIPCTL